MALTADIFSSATMNAIATSSAILYQREAVNVLNATTASAVNVGTLEYNKSQIDVVGNVMKENTSNIYKFKLVGDQIKVNLDNISNSSTLRAQLIDSTGTVVADSEGTAAQKTAYRSMTSSGGLKAKSGDYYVKIAFGSTALKSKAQAYSLALYSGTTFSKSYQTTATSQTKPSQRVMADNTLTFATSDARKYGTNATIQANSSAESAATIGWLYENKSALAVTSQMSAVIPEAYYSVTFQKGSNLKLALNNHTNTTGLRVQLLDTTGSKVFADSNGTEEQKAAYASLTSSDGLKAKTGNYVVKVSYDKSADHTKPQVYDFKLYSGNSYENLYETTAAVEDFKTAMLDGTWNTKYDSATATSAYLQSAMQGYDVDIMETLRSIA